MRTAEATPPAFELPAHSSPIDLRFYTGDKFPAAYRGANSVVQYLYDKGAKLDVVALDGRTPLIIADGVEYGNSFAAQPHTAALLRKLGAKEMKCPGLCEAMIREEAIR